MKTPTLLLSILLLFYGSHLKAQQRVNAYARVTSISGTTLTLTNVNETHDTYEDGQQILLWQVQDDVLGGNTSNNTTFGDIAAIQSAGLFEVVTILSHTEAAGVPNTLVIDRVPQHTYATGPNSRLQAISFPNLGSPNFTTTTDITGLPWDGNIGGVVAFNVTGTLTLNHHIHADQLGFRGGAVSRNVAGPACSSTPFISNSNEYGQKGEGVYHSTNTNFNFALAKIANGGGGGNHHNGGGGGGANYTAGGRGGHGWNGGQVNCPGGNDAGGFGGAALSTFINSSRLFFGGGGGGGQQNNSRGSSGANGGGFVFLRAETLATTDTCPNHAITANGGNSSDGGNDGMGGAGAGGSIALDISNYTIASTCPLLVESNGGNGGSVNSNTHAGGGGGGQGVVFYTTTPPNNTTTNTFNGNGGCNNNTNPCNNQAASGNGTNNSGIFTSVFLPVELRTFEGQWVKEHRSVDLYWLALTTPDLTWFDLERSTDGIHFETIYTTPVQHLANQASHYTHTDKAPIAGLNYYRLRQAHRDGSHTYSKVIVVSVPEGAPNILIYPNPAHDVLQVQVPGGETAATCELLTINGQMVTLPTQTLGSQTTLYTDQLPRGIYLLRVSTPQVVKTVKIILH